MNIRLDFWRDPSGWPRDTGSHVFLARAVHEVGKALFGEGWTGDETYIDLMQSLPEKKLEGSGGRQYFAHDLLLRYHPEFKRKQLSWPSGTLGGFGAMPPSVNFTDEEWAAARAIVKRDHEAKLLALHRFSQATEQIIRLAEAEKMKTALRPKAGGDPVPIPRAWWNSERVSVRFVYCQMNPSDPFGNGVAGDRYFWIFVTRESLEASLDLLSTLAAPETATASKRGRPQSYDWDDAMDFARRELDKRGDFNDPSNAVDGWRGQADLVRLVLSYMVKFNDGKEPSESMVKSHLKMTIEQWRLSR